jgi:hypothetical protein
MTKRVRFGDIIEIQTRKGLSYVQYTHRNELFGYLVHVLPGFFKSRPPDFNRIAGQETQFVAFIPLQAALNRHIFHVVGNVKIPESKIPFPMFRAAGGSGDRITGKISTWWLWDGEKSWIIGPIKPEQRKLPIKEVWNDTLLIDRIEAGWRPQDDSG